MKSPKIIQVIKDNAPSESVYHIGEAWRVKAFDILDAIGDGLSYIKDGSDNVKLSDVKDYISIDKLEDLYLRGRDEAFKDSELNTLIFKPEFLKVKIYFENGLIRYDVKKLIQSRELKPGVFFPKFGDDKQDDCCYEHHSYASSILFHTISLLENK